MFQYVRFIEQIPSDAGFIAISSAGFHFAELHYFNYIIDNFPLRLINNPVS